MATLPFSIAKYIRATWMAQLIVTYLHTDPEGKLIDWGGHPQHYGLTNLVIGQSIAEQVHFLEGLLPVSHTEILEFVGMSTGRSAHIHILPLQGDTWILLFDATIEHDRQQKIQQQLNELGLLTYRQSQLINQVEAARSLLLDEKHKLQEAYELKNRFITAFSNELRTPVTSIINYTDLLNQIVAADKQEFDYLFNIQNTASHILGLIDNILEQARLEAGKVVLRPTNCEIKQLVADLKTLFIPTAESKGLLFEIEGQDTLPIWIVIDEIRFRQILIQLITNALKFTEQGFVQVTLGWQEERLEFSVADSGPGISPTHQQQIFTSTSLPKIPDTSTTSAGLGLAISRQLITLMQGEFHISSMPGLGTIFSGFVHAPLAQIKVTNIDDTAIIAKVLLAESALTIRALFEVYLQDEHYTVVSVNDGAEVVRAALQTQPDIILIDMQMSMMDGYQAVRQLRQQNFNKAIIALSASSLPEDQQAALEIGCNFYLVKPVAKDVLLKTVEHALYLSSLKQQSRQA